MFFQRSHFLRTHWYFMKNLHYNMVLPSELMYWHEDIVFLALMKLCISNFRSTSFLDFFLQICTGSQSIPSVSSSRLTARLIATSAGGSCSQSSFITLTGGILARLKVNVETPCSFWLNSKPAYKHPSSLLQKFMDRAQLHSRCIIW